MNKLLLALVTLCCATQTSCSVQYTENISPIVQSCSSKYFNTQHQDRIPTQRGIPTLHEIAFKAIAFKKLKPTLEYDYELEPILKNAITDLIHNKYDDENDKQKTFNFVETIATHSPHVFEKFINTPIDTRIPPAFLFNPRSFLYHASEANNPEMITCLLNAGALVNQIDDYHNAPLHGAAFSAADKAIPLLISAGAHVNLQNSFYETPLCHAAHKNEGKVILLLIAAGAHVNQQDKLGFTPLHVATLSKADKIIPLLIDAGAHTSIKNHESKTPRMLINNPATLEIFDRAVTTRSLKQLSATRIQALGRGFIARKNK